MEKLFSNIIGTPIFEDDSFRPFTAVRDLIIDPERGKLIGIVVNINKNHVISPMDIISWDDVIKVNSMESVVSADEILRVSQVLSDDIQIMNNKVVTKRGKELGNVVNYSINISTGDLMKIYTAKGFLGLIRYENRIITADNIVEILPEKIVVKHDIKPVKQEEKGKVRMEDMAVS